MTEFASEWLVAGVLSGVSDEVRTLAECFSTDLASMRLFSCKNKTREKKQQQKKIIKIVIQRIYQWDFGIFGV